MSDNNHKIDEDKIQYDNVFSIPIVQYQTTNTDELNKEDYKSPGEKTWSGMDVRIRVYDGTYENGDILYERSEEKLKVPTKDEPNGEYFPLSDIVMIEKATEENIKVINENWDLSSAHSKTTGGGSTWGAAFGILAIVGEVMYKGATVVFILRLKNGMDIKIYSEIPSFFKE